MTTVSLGTTSPTYPSSTTGGTSGYLAFAESAFNSIGKVDSILDSNLSGADKGEALMHVGGELVVSYFAPYLTPFVGKIQKFLSKTGLDKLSVGRKVSRWLGSKFFGSKTIIEQKRWGKLIEQGYKYAPDGATDTSRKRYVSKGESIRPDLPPDFVGFDRNGVWVNNAFSNSREEKDLKAQDIWGYAAWPEKFGNRWMEIPESARESICAKALELGVVREHHGTIDIEFTPELDAFCKEKLGI